MRLLFYIVLLGLTAWLGLYLYETPGNLQLSLKDTVIDMPLWLPVMTAIVTIFVLGIIFSFFAAIHRAYRRVRDWITGSSTRAVIKNANLGWLALAEGDWSHAEAYMLKAAKHSDNPLHYYLAAAKAAQEAGSIESRDNCIRMALRVAPESQVAIWLTQAKLQTKQGQYEHALASLQELYKSVPHNIVVLKLFVTVYTAMGDWQELLRLMPQLKKHSVLPPEELLAIEAKCYNHMLDLEAKKSGSSSLISYWENMPRNAKQIPEVIEKYTQLLVALGENNEAESVIRNALKRHWDVNLVKVYGLALSSDLSKQISTAEHWLRSHQTEPALLLTLARLCLANKLWGKARSYLDATISLQPNADAYAELGRLLGFLGEQQKALECYKSGLLEFASVLPIEQK